MNSRISDLRQQFINHADAVTKKSGERFFKESVSLYGVKSAIVEKIAKDFFASVKSLAKKEIFTVCEELWKSGMMEESFVACHVAYALRKQFTPDDFFMFERWVHAYVSNWASCDTFCNHTMGTFIDMYPTHIVDLKRWATSSNRWVKRASAVTFIIPARQGRYLTDIFDIADILLEDGDDLVQKGYGWMLKAASQAHQQEVYAYVMKHKLRMPRTALRYAIEKMPKFLKEQAMAK